MNAARKKVVVEQYGIGGAAGHARALVWLADPQRGDPRVGGTLSKHVLELVDLMADTATAESAERVRGEIVGFCYAIECPEHAAACQAVAKEAAGRLRVGKHVDGAKHRRREGQRAAHEGGGG